MIQIPRLGPPAPIIVKHRGHDFISEVRVPNHIDQGVGESADGPPVDANAAGNAVRPVLLYITNLV